MPTFTYEDLVQKTLSPQTRKALADQIKQDVDAYCVREFTDDHRHHLGMSIIGEECWRKIWYAWRWAKFGVFDGRMLRLFNRGHLEEARFIRWLEGIGAKVWAIDPATGKQYKISLIDGHYGGSNDSVVVLPYFPDLPMLGEFKTHNYKSFSNLISKTLVVSKPEHYAQMCSYGKFYNLKYGLYCAVNKNDDDLYYEVVELNWDHADNSVSKAQEIIYAKEPPAKLSLKPEYFECKNFCPFLDICHHGAPVEKNCRSCKCATPVANAEWHCSRYDAIIPKEWLMKGCPDHVPIG